MIEPNRQRARRSARTKRRIYADLRELLALEPEAKRLSFSSGHTQALPAEAATPEMDTHALVFPEQHRDSAWAGSQSAEGFTAAPAEPLDPQFRAHTEAPAMIVVDQRMTMFYGSRRNMKSVIAAKAAALIAWRMLAEKKPVGAVIFNDRKIVQLRPYCGRLRVILMLHALLNQNHALLPNAGIRSNLTMLNEALRRTDQLIRGNSLVFLITDASGHDEETSRLASGISRDKRLVVVLVYDPRQTEFRGNRSFIANPCARQLGAETGDRHSRETLHGTFGRQQSIGRRFFPDEVPIIPLNTRDDVAEQLRRALRKLFPSPSSGASTSLSELNHPKLETTDQARPDEVVPPANWNITTEPPGSPPAGPWPM